EKLIEQNKKDILKATLYLFQEYRVQKGTIDQRAKKAHVSKVTIYYFFECKDNLVYHVFKYYVDDIWEEQKEMLESDIPCNKKIEKIIFEKGVEADQKSKRVFQEYREEYAGGKSYIETLHEHEALALLR